MECHEQFNKLINQSESHKRSTSVAQSVWSRVLHSCAVLWSIIYKAKPLRGEPENVVPNFLCSLQIEKTAATTSRTTAPTKLTVDRKNERVANVIFQSHNLNSQLQTLIDLLKWDNSQNKSIPPHCWTDPIKYTTISYKILTQQWARSQHDVKRYHFTHINFKLITNKIKKKTATDPMEWIGLTFGCWDRRMWENPFGRHHRARRRNWALAAGQDKTRQQQQQNERQLAFLAIHNMPYEMVNFRDDDQITDIWDHT